MSFAGYSQTGGAIQDGGSCRGVLRTANRTVLWTCAHEHDSRFGAISCAYQAEGQARAAGLLPDPPQAKWNDPTTWPPELRKKAERVVTIADG